MNRTPRAVLISGSALVAAVALANAWLLSSHEGNLRAELAAAVGTSLPFEGRLSGGFLPSDDAGAKRSGDTATPALSPDARIAIALLEKRATDKPTTKALADLGVAYLVQGDIDRAIDTLSDVVAAGPDATTWNDLAAAYLAKAHAQPSRSVEYLSRALEAAVRSMRLSPSKEALFNRALACEGLMPFVGGDAPWHDYLRRETDPRWVNAAQRVIGKRVPKSANENWDVKARDLERHLAESDERSVIQTVRRFPAATSELLGRLIREWADIQLTSDAGAASSALAKARLLSTAIESVIGDRMPPDTVAALRGGGAGLARAHQIYDEGVRQYARGDYQRARASFEAARIGFIAAKSPYAYWADMQLAMILFQQRRLDDADRAFRAIAERARVRHYETLLGRVLSLRGLVDAKAWRLPEALEAFRDAAATFERTGQPEHVVTVHSLMADTLRSLGEHHASWESIGKTLGGLDHITSPVARYLMLYNASLFASNQQLFEAALLFQGAAVRQSAAAGPFAVVEALTARATINLRRGERSDAVRDLSSAEASLPHIPDGPLRRYADAELRVLAAELRERPFEPAGVDRLKDAISFFSEFEPARVPKLYLTLARLHSAHGSDAAAEEALETGIAKLETQQSALGDDTLKISYFDESWALFQDMVSLQLQTQRDASNAFRYAERSRARSLLSEEEGAESPLIQAPGDIQRFLGENTLLVYYATLPDRVLIWTVDRSGVGFTQTQVSASELLSLVSRHRAGLLVNRSTSGDRRLYDLLITPIADALVAKRAVVFAADGELQQLPFATLRSPVTNRYLIEDVAILMTPSARFFAAARARLTRMATAPSHSALLIGNPVTTAAAALPGAEAEATAAAKFYAEHAVWIGGRAGKDAFLVEAPRFDVIHFGGHGYANPEYPLLSRLAFSAVSGKTDGSLFAYEISKLRFDRTRLVVLAACRTADGAVSLGEGVVSIARPFLAAGVPTVVAGQWDLDDRITQQVMLNFHRRFSQTQDAVGALREAQLTLLNSNDPVLASPGAWGAFVALGAM